MDNWTIKNLETGEEQPYNPASAMGKMSVKKHPKLHSKEYMKKLGLLKKKKSIKK